MFVSSAANNSVALSDGSSVLESSVPESSSSSEVVEEVEVDSSASVDELEASSEELESVSAEDDDSVVLEGSLEALVLELATLLDLLALFDLLALDPDVLVELGEAVELAEDEVGLTEDEVAGFLDAVSEDPPLPPLLLNTTRVALAPLGTETTQKFAPPAPGPCIWETSLTPCSAGSM